MSGMDKTINESIGFAETIDFLKKHGFNPKNENESNPTGFNRVIEFSDENGQVYFIVWFINMSTLHVGNRFRSCQFPFRWIYHDTTFPMSGGNNCIGFSYDRNERGSVFDREFPFAVVRIPCPQIEKEGAKQ